MAIQHAGLGEVIDLATFGPEGKDSHSVALVKTDHFETMRLFVGAGTSVPQHKVNGPITVQCLRGTLKFLVGTKPKLMSPGTWLHIDGGQPHAIEAETDCVLLVTILLIDDEEE